MDFRDKPDIFDSELILYTRNIENERVKPVFEYQITF